MCTVNGDPITGVVKDYYMNGVLKDEGNYEDGLLNGFSKTYYENVDGIFVEAKNPNLSSKIYYEKIQEKRNFSEYCEKELNINDANLL